MLGVVNTVWEILFAFFFLVIGNALSVYQKVNIIDGCYTIYPKIFPIYEYLSYNTKRFLYNTKVAIYHIDASNRSKYKYM